MLHTTIHIGIDAGKHALDVATPADTIKLDNTPTGLDKLDALLSQMNANPSAFLITCEPTGGYERLLTTSLENKGYPVHTAHPNKARAYAKTKGILAKTDKIDANLLREYANVMKVKPNHDYASAAQKALAEFTKRRAQLIDHKTKEQARPDKPLPDIIATSINKHTQWINDELITIEKAIDELINQSPAMKKNIGLLLSIPSVERQTAHRLIASLPELGQCEQPALAALVGRAPFNRDSGQYRGKRFIQGGRPAVRKALYMSCISGIRYNSVIRETYQRLRQAGKPAKVALVAAMRKLLLIANALLNDKLDGLINLITLDFLLQMLLNIKAGIMSPADYKNFKESCASRHIGKVL